ncbi:hypothetical protein IQ07DRAFT_636514 [Pyrenochaeta sp. DS3sAY3a]|nr:hypothetical protein IQ07DRAFT_636514 [Pyrenochaeta sp. DS3sAY3a]
MSAPNPSPPSNPISPLPTSSTSTTSPLSPTTFPHKTSPAVATQTPLINTDTPAINAGAPVEIDGTEMDGETVRRRGTGESGVLVGGAGVGSRVGSGVLSPGDEEDIDGEFLGEGEGGVGRVRANRAAILASRSKDPSVIVDVPQDPTAEEVEAAKSAEGTVTPGPAGPGELR